MIPCATNAQRHEHRRPVFCARPIIMYTVFAIYPRGISLARRVFEFSFCKQTRRTGRSIAIHRGARVSPLARSSTWHENRCPAIGTLDLLIPVTRDEPSIARSIRATVPTKRSRQTSARNRSKPRSCPRSFQRS